MQRQTRDLTRHRKDTFTWFLCLSVLVVLLLTSSSQFLSGQVSVLDISAKFRNKFTEQPVPVGFNTPVPTPKTALSVDRIIELSLVALWDSENDMVLAGSLAFHPDGSVLALGSMDGFANLWSVSDGHVYSSLRGHSYRISRLAYSLDGTILATGAVTGIVQLWQVSESQLLHSFEEHKSPVQSLTFSADGALLAAAGMLQDHLAVWRVADGNLLWQIRSGDISAIAFSPDGKYLALAITRLELEKEAAYVTLRVEVRTAGSGEQIRLLEEFKSEPRRVAYSPDGQILAIGMADGTIELWQTSDWQRLRVWKGHRSEVTALSFQPGTTMLVSGDGHGIVRIWHASQRALSQPLLRELTVHREPIVDAVFSADSKFLVVGSLDGTVSFWSIAIR
jgi:WD40 repeat protein